MLVRMVSSAQYDLLNFRNKGTGLGFGRGSLAKALMDYYKDHTNTDESRELMDSVKRFYSRWSIAGKKIKCFEDVYLGMALIDLQQVTGNEKYKSAIDSIFAYLKNYETDEMGSFTVKDKKKNEYFYAETIGMLCPFLAKYGKTYDNPDATSMAVTQIQNFVRLGIDEKTMLPYHAIDVKSQMKMGIIGWGQAVGKLMMGMAETLYYMDSENPGYEIVKQAFRRIVDKVEAYQLEGGLYTWQLSAKEGPVDTAASAMILYAIALSLEDKVLIGIHRNRLLRGIEALKMCIQEDGTLPGAAAESNGINNYPMEFGSYPWGLGPALSLLVLTEKM